MPVCLPAFPATPCPARGWLAGLWSAWTNMQLDGALNGASGTDNLFSLPSVAVSGLLLPAPWLAVRLEEESCTVSRVPPLLSLR